MKIMNKIETKLKGVYILEPRVFGDYRGYFFESWNERVLHELGIDINFVQDNQSFSAEQGPLIYGRIAVHIYNGFR